MQEGYDISWNMFMCITWIVINKDWQVFSHINSSHERISGSRTSLIWWDQDVISLDVYLMWWIKSESFVCVLSPPPYINSSTNITCWWPVFGSIFFDSTFWYSVRCLYPLIKLAAGDIMMRNESVHHDFLWSVDYKTMSVWRHVVTRRSFITILFFFVRHQHHQNPHHIHDHRAVGVVWHETRE